CREGFLLGDDLRHLLAVLRFALHRDFRADIGRQRLTSLPDPLQIVHFTVLDLRVIARHDGLAVYKVPHLAQGRIQDLFPLHPQGAAKVYTPGLGQADASAAGASPAFFTGRTSTAWPKDALRAA